MRILLILWAIALMQFGLLSQVTHADLRVVDLRTEYRVNPLGIDDARPRLFWRVTSDERGQKQTAYRIMVASTRDHLTQGNADLWDSAKVSSSASLHIEYAGKPLTSRQQCYWRVQVWDHDGEASAWSEPASWSMGLLTRDDWSSSYISYRDETPIFDDRQSLFLPPSRYYRKEFAATKKVRRATVYATALGIYELELNGHRLGDAYFAPGWTDYRQRAYYNTYDVTELVGDGANAIGATVADGWYSGYVAYGLLVSLGTEKIGRYTYGKTPAVMAQLELEYEDGSREIVGTDNSWTVTGNGPIREADLLMGESYDARMELNGWSQVGFDDSDWEAAIPAADNGSTIATFYEAEDADGSGRTPQIKGRPIDLGFQAPSRLEAFPGEPVRVTEELLPVEITNRGNDTYIFNLGQNFAGTIRLRLNGPAGQRVTIRYAEMLHPDGRLMTENLRKARATDHYICKGDAEGESFSPRFTYHGFQYVEVAGLPQPPDEDTLTGLVLHSDTPLTSSFECSDPMVNQLFSNVVWTQRANFVDLPTDCPQRDERMGWTGDAQVYVGTAIYNADVAAFYKKWLRELMESQRPSGAFPGFAPTPFHRGFDFGTAWTDAGVICPWTIWQAYGDTRVIEDCWQPMTRFIDWRIGASRDDLGVQHGTPWGDWLAQGAKTPIPYIDTIYFAISTRMMAEMAEAIGRNDQAAMYREQLERTKQAFRATYLTDDGKVTADTQTAYALALFADLVPAEMRETTGQRLAEKIAESGNHMTTGFLGTRPLLPALSASGQHDLAAFLLQTHEFPSWGYEVDQGATSIWERWDSYTKEDAFGRHNAAMNSFSHYAFGAVCEWMFRTLAGIRSDGPGFQKIIIHPHPPAVGSNAMHEPIDWVRASYESIRGTIRSDWKIEGDQFQLNVTIPTNTTATVFLPTDDVSQITESGDALRNNSHVILLRTENGTAVLSVASGEYKFVARGGVPRSTVALKTSIPKDKSINPEGIDLRGATELVRWDFHRPEDAAKWSGRKSVDIVVRDGRAYLVATGPDSQMTTTLSSELTGRLVIALRAKPADGATSQIYWAGPGQGFNASRQSQRDLAPTDQVNTYLFAITVDGALKKIRFDPFATYNKRAKPAEMLIEEITIFRLEP